ncbi:MAG: type II secretion system protein GspG [Acidobacteria bacterium]|nr:type II secretion system protein GspG [Acidobacteriota bacterium]
MNTHRRSRKLAQAGVTLIEMLVVVTIIALFAAVVGPRLLNRGDQARVVATKAQLESFMTALGAYKLDTGLYPNTELGLNALRVRPANLNNWNGPYLPKDVPMDAWGRPFLYRYPGEHGDEPEIVSLGADGQPGGEGINADVASWK